MFDQNSTGLVFSAVKMPVMKLGLVFCLNRPTQLYHIAEPIFDKKKLKELTDDAKYLKQINPETEYLAMYPRFSADFSKLAYIGRDEKFLSHSANYQLKIISWPLQQEKASSVTVLDRHKEYPTDEEEFCGLYGY